ncbi:MAG: serine/threonine-protein kinase [Candidatus Competibacteraceae bacterium]|jgi:serine/threonine-protein kinase PpkA|nr:serine/threonine-protein kinase [Candidatus Competibacteraceae bacterium]
MVIPGYRIERQLGRGGMATVYLALQESLNRHVALKVIKPELAENEEFARRFLREGHIIGRLNDPRIVKVFDVGVYENNYYLVMEYLSGETLQERIQHGLDLQEALRIGKIVAGALGYAHKYGVIHRDIKPQNILFHENGDPLLTDFGIAKSAHSNTSLTATGLSLGTPRYMSPEQIRGQEITARSDLYSLGVMFFELLTGQLPYRAEDSLALAFLHVTEPIPQLPASLARFQPILEQLLAKQSEDRFASAEHFIDALNRLEQQPTASVPNLDKAVLDHAANRFNPPSRTVGIATSLVLTSTVLLLGHTWLATPDQITAEPPAINPAPVEPPLPATDTTLKQQRADFLLAQVIHGRSEGMSLDSQLAIVAHGLSLAPGHAGLLAVQAELQVSPPTEPTAPKIPIYIEQQRPQATTESANVSVLTSALEQQLPTPTNTEQDAADYRLTVKPQPQNARVRILNIKPRYYDGISLSPGSYHIAVDHPGYRSQNRWITIADQDVELAITLSRAPADSRQSASRKSKSVSKSRREKKGGIKGFFEKMDRKIQDIVH